MAYLTVAEAAQRLGIGVHRVHTLIREGRIKATTVKVERRAIDEAEVERFAALPRKGGRPSKPSYSMVVYQVGEVSLSGGPLSEERLAEMARKAAAPTPDPVDTLN